MCTDVVQSRDNFLLPPELDQPVNGKSFRKKDLIDIVDEFFLISACEEFIRIMFDCINDDDDEAQVVVIISPHHI